MKWCGNQLRQKELDSTRRPDAWFCSDRCRLRVGGGEASFRASKEGDYKSRYKAEIRDPESVKCPIDFTGGAA
jgi:hypothetical protein